MGINSSVLLLGRHYYDVGHLERQGSPPTIGWFEECWWQLVPDLFTYKSERVPMEIIRLSEHDQITTHIMDKFILLFQVHRYLAWLLQLTGTAAMGTPPACMMYANTL